MRKRILFLATGLMLLLAIGFFAGTHAGRAAVQGISAWVWPLDEHLDRETVLQGEQANSSFGYTLAHGDFNGDQAQDLLVSAPAYKLGAHASGKVYLFSGPITWGQELTASQADLTIASTGSAANLGYTLAGGDLNGDGSDEIIISARADDYLNAGKYVFVYAGSSQIGDGTNIPYTLEINPPVWRIRGYRIGDIITCDFNGDGYQDFFTTELVGDLPDLRVFGLLGSEAALDAPRIIDPPDGVDIEIGGFEVASWIDPPYKNLSCGDIDGDGIEDLVVGAWSESPNQIFEAGSVYIIQGRQSYTSTQAVHLTVPQDAGMILQGSDHMYLSGDQLGTGFSVADFNGDGKADIVAGARDADGLNNLYGEGGEVYMWFGRPLDGSTDLIVNQAASVIYPAMPHIYSFGTQMASGDFNGDLEQDLLVGCGGCPGEPFINDARGMALVIENPGVLNSWHTLQQAADWLGIQSLTIGEIGGSIAAADLDGDGVDDLAMGAPYGAGYQTDDPGVVYLLPYPSQRHSWLPLIGR